MHYGNYKSILSPQNVMNLYRGCTHGCIYCDARSTCYQMKHDFEDIEIKADAIKILEQQLHSKRTPCMISSGSMCDPYIALEEKTLLTRQCLQLIHKYGFGLAIQTKSASILRDLDLLCAINKQTKCVVQVTLTTFDDKLCSLIEPNVSNTSQRFQALLALQNSGIPTVVWMTPILPFINDTEQNLYGLLDYCIRAKVYGIINFGFGVTLRQGDREYFYNKLDLHFPSIKNKYINTFGNSYNCLSPSSKRLQSIFEAECKKHGIVYKPNEVFAYLKSLPQKSEQLSLFDDPPNP